jgi:hypothetical protein
MTFSAWVIATAARAYWMFPVSCAASYNQGRESVGSVGRANATAEFAVRPGRVSHKGNICQRRTADQDCDSEA